MKADFTVFIGQKKSKIIKLENEFLDIKTVPFQVTGKAMKPILDHLKLGNYELTQVERIECNKIYE